jgi:hypothetical protein
MRRRNSSEASTKPATTPTTMSNTTVAVKQVSSTSTSLRGAVCSTCTKWRTSLIRQATTSSSAAIAASGSWSSSGAPNTIASSRKPAWTRAGDRRGGAGAHVRRGARDRAGRREATEQRGQQVAGALGEQFGVRVVLVAAHRVGRDRRQQRLHRAEQRDHDGTRHQRLHGRPLQAERGPVRIGLLPRPRERRSARRHARHDDAVDEVREARADGRHREVRPQAVQAAGGERGPADRDQRRRQARPDARQQEQQGEGRAADRGVVRLQRGQGGDRVQHGLVEVLRRGDAAQPEQVLDLPHRDHHRDARREAGDHGERQELDHPPEPGEPEQEQDRARHHRRQHQPARPVLLDDRQEDHHERGGRAAHLYARAADEGGDGAGDDRGVEAVLRRDAGRDRERHRERQGDDADDQAGEEVGAEAGEGVALAQGVEEGGGRGGQAGLGGRGGLGCWVLRVRGVRRARGVRGARGVRAWAGGFGHRGDEGTVCATRGGGAECVGTRRWARAGVRAGGGWNVGRGLVEIAR